MTGIMERKSANQQDRKSFLWKNESETLFARKGINNRQLVRKKKNYKSKRKQIGHPLPGNINGLPEK